MLSTTWSIPWWVVLLSGFTACLIGSILRNFRWRHAILTSFCLHVIAIGVLPLSLEKPLSAPRNKPRPPMSRREEPVVRLVPRRSSGIPFSGASVSRLPPHEVPTAQLPVPGTVVALGRTLPRVREMNSFPVESPAAFAVPDVPTEVLDLSGAGIGDRGPPVVPLPRPNPLSSAAMTAMQPGAFASPLSQLDISGTDNSGFFFLAIDEKNVLILDRSASMKSDHKCVVVLEELLAALQESYDAAASTEVEVIFFNDTWRPINGTNGELKLSRVTDELLGRIRQQIEINRHYLADPNGASRNPDDILPRGGTLPQPPLLAALALQPDKIIFLTDGEILPRDLDLDVIHKANGHGTKIDVVEITKTVPTDEAKAARIAYKLAEQNSGEFRFAVTVPNASQP
jgi:hypothetical protein